MDVISDMTGVDIDVDGGDDEEVELDVEDDDVEGVMAEGDPKMPELDQPGDPQFRSGGSGESPATASEKKAQAAVTAESVARYRHALKQEVLRRVQGRIHQERHNDAVADQLSERILQRIKNRR